VKPEAQRLAIAEACGWRNIRELDDLYPDGSVAAGVWWQGKSPDGDSDQLLPDYLNDLNAMHEAEKILENPQENGRLMSTYSVWKLTEVCNAYTKGHEKSRAGSTVTYWLIHATAAQRAEAFLRTLGKWEDTQP
jgi:hypothetical protein